MGGAFITHPHTFKQYRSLYNPSLFDRSAYLKWEEKGSEDISVVANRIWKKRIKDFVEPDLPEGIKTKLKSYVEQGKVDR